VKTQADRRRLLRWLAGLAVAALSLWLLARNVDGAAVWAVLARADLRWAAVGVLAILGTALTRALRWQALLEPPAPRLRPVLTALLVGQALNMALPLRSGEVVRAAWLGAEPQVDPARALGSIALEKALDLLALLACGLALLLWLPLPDWFARSTAGTALLIAVAAVALWAGLRWREPLLGAAARLLTRLPARASSGVKHLPTPCKETPAGWNRLLLSPLERLTDGLAAIRQPRVFWPALGWTALTWALGVGANWVVLAAFGIPSTAAALLLMATLMASAPVPVPARLGIFEGVCVVSLALFDIPFDQALAVGLLLHLIVMAPPLLAAALLALWRAVEVS